ncbi:MAG: exosome complex exonuclease Rrp41 [Nanoarchaeota archaeon]
MTYTKRNDGRRFDELRPMEAKVGVIKRADGSAMFKIGSTIAYASVYGPRALHPTFMRNPEHGLLRCNYNMMAFSGSGDRVRPGPSRRSKEISQVTKNALEPVLDLTNYPNMVVDIFVELLQTDAGTRCAGICAAAMALADAGFSMKDMVSAVSVGLVGDKVVVDLDKEEEDYEDGSVDIPVAMTHRHKKITLLQLDGIIPEKQLQEALKKAEEACESIHKVQRKAMLEGYKHGL